MAELKLDFSDEQTKQLMVRAAMEALTPDVRDGIMRAAVTHIMTVPKDTRGYGYRDTPLLSPIQQAFFDATVQVTREVVSAHVRDSPDVRAAIAELVTKATTELVSQKASDELALAVRGTLTAWLAAPRKRPHDED